jgi:hypothetical protein
VAEALRQAGEAHSCSANAAQARLDRMTYNNEPGVPAIAAKPAPGAVSRIRNYFLTGLIVAGPVAVTLWLICRCIFRVWA